MGGVVGCDWAETPLPVEVASVDKETHPIQMPRLVDSPLHVASEKEALGCDDGTGSREQLQQNEVQKTLADFLRQALKGRPIRLLNLDDTVVHVKSFGATLRVEKDFSRMVFEPRPEETSCPTIWCPFASIIDIYQFHVDGVGAFPENILSTLIADEPDLVLRVDFLLADSSEKQVYFLEQSCSSRDQFLQCAKVLHGCAMKKESGVTAA